MKDRRNRCKNCGEYCSFLTTSMEFDTAVLPNCCSRHNDFEGSKFTAEERMVLRWAHDSDEDANETWNLINPEYEFPMRLIKDENNL